MQDSADPRYPAVSRPAGDFGPSRRRLRPAVTLPLEPGLQVLHLLCPRPLHHWVEFGGVFRIAEELRARLPGVVLHLWMRSELRDASPYALLPVDRISPIAEEEERLAARLAGKGSAVVRLGTRGLSWHGPAAESPAARDAGRTFLRALQRASPRWISQGGNGPVGIDRVLVHQSRFHVGDALWLTPLLRQIRRQFPAASTTVVAPPAALPLLAANPHVSAIVPYDGRATEEARHSVLERLAGRRFDAALFAFARRPESCWLARTVDARYRVNLEYFDPALDWRLTPSWLTHEGWCFWGAMPSPRMLLHALDPLVDQAGWTEEDRRVDLHLSAADHRRAEELLATRGIAGEPFAVMAPGGLSSRRWPAERFARLASLLSGELGLHVLVEGSPAEEPLLAAIAGAAGEGRTLAATDPLPVFAALLERAALLVANDSAPIHLAEAVKTPCLYFAQREKLVHSHPAGDRCWALYDEVSNDPRRITVGQALAAVRHVLRALAKARVSSYPPRVS